MDIKKLVAQMTLEEKAGLCSGDDFWHTKAVERLGIPRVMVSDGPHGLRKQDETGDHLGVNDSIEAVCFPAACATAASFDRALLRTMGEALGEECQAEGVGVILGPAVNIKRSPLCGRNFEYFSEDPYLAGELAAAQIEGVQSRNVGTSLKHFLANNQEHRRMSASSEIDERTLREIYLAAFEGAVKKAEPWTVMCSYNRVNGVYAAQNERCLTDILRDEWGFDGFVVSDWGAVNDRVADLRAGLELEMPASGGINDRRIVEAVRSGALDEAVLDRAAERILGVLYRFLEHRDEGAVFDREAHHALSRRLAAECLVLLQNDGVLPLREETSMALIGAFARKPRYQGGGSSHIHSFRTESALEAADPAHVSFAEGYAPDGGDQEALRREAVELAARAQVAVIFAGLPDACESESFDRAHMRLPEEQNALIEAVCDANPRTVVVLHNGSPVEMPWAGRVGAILEAYLGGQAVGGAVMDALYGRVNPCGRLAETFPKKLEDNPSYLYFGGEGDRVEYREGVFVGYRYYDKKKMDVLFPFGHGLSYTTFDYGNLRLDRASMTEDETLLVSVDVANTGARAGKEVVQLYVAAPRGEIIRPVRELRGFEKVALAPDETKTVTFPLSRRAFAYFDTAENDWLVESGTYGIELAHSSRDIRVRADVEVRALRRRRIRVTPDAVVEDILKIDGAAEVLRPLMDRIAPMSGENGNALGEGTRDMMAAMMRYMPVRGMLSFGGGKLSWDDVLKLCEGLNELAGNPS